MNYQDKHRLALINPYQSVVKVFDCKEGDILTGIKNSSAIPNALMHRLEKTGFALHTIDKKSQLAGRAVDTQLINPISGRLMSGSSSGTAINVFAGINDLGIGNDGGGSVLAPAISLNIIGFISRLIEIDRIQNEKENTDGMLAGNSLGFMTRDRGILLKAIKDSVDVEAADDYGIIFSDKEYDNINSKIIELKDCMLPRQELTEYLESVLSECDVLVIQEGPIDLEGFGDSLFGHFDERTKAIQNASGKGYVRVCNTAKATALALPGKQFGCATLLICQSNKDKLAKLLKAAEYIEDYHDPLIERYFLDINSYIDEGYQV